MRCSVSLPRLSRRSASSYVWQSVSNHLPDRTAPTHGTAIAAAVLAVAALVLAILGFGLGAFVGPPGMNVRSPSAEANLTSAKLSSHGHVMGEVMVSSGTPAWMFMTVDAGAWSSKVTCEVTLVERESGGDRRLQALQRLRRVGRAASRRSPRGPFGAPRLTRWLGTCERATHVVIAEQTAFESDLCAVRVRTP